jgi:hypothetical protein
MLKSFLLLSQLLVICHPEDSLRPVAQEIASQENAALADSWVGAKGEYLLWVVEPGRLSDQTIIAFARAWKEQFPETAVGLIIGRTPQQAQDLWKSGRQARNHPIAAVDTRSAPISKADFLKTLTTHRYLTFAGHGGQTFLALSEKESLRSRDLPPLNHLVLGTASCNVFRPWAEDSIALAFAEKGAAVFAGFAYSPEAGYLVGCYHGWPFRYTSPDFPIGRVIQLQNQGAMQAFAALPYYLLLGDPRIALSSGPGYARKVDEESELGRTITMTDMPQGFLPLRIRGGAAFSRIEAAGTAFAQGYPFYNSRLQAMDIGADKYVLVEHSGGTLSLRLSRQTSAWWLARTVILESLDTVLLFLVNSRESAMILIILGLIALAIVFRTGLTQSTVLAGAMTGSLLALGHLGWMLARLENAAVTSKALHLNPLTVVATLLLTGCAAALFVRSHGWRGRIVALSLASFPAWFPGLLHLGMTASANWFIFRPRIGAEVYNYHCALLALLAAVMLALFFALIFTLISRIPGIREKSICQAKQKD